MGGVNVKAVELRCGDAPGKDCPHEGPQAVGKQVFVHRIPYTGRASCSFLAFNAGVRIPPRPKLVVDGRAECAHRRVSERLASGSACRKLRGREGRPGELGATGV